MSKHYLCKGCINNKNGWCTKLKVQGLKNITECEFKSDNLNETVQKEIDKKQEIESEKYRNFGKREMMYYVCKQIFAMQSKGMTSISIDELKDLMCNMEIQLNVYEQLSGIALECEIDRILYTSCRTLIGTWRHEINEKNN